MLNTKSSLAIAAVALCFIVTVCSAEFCPLKDFRSDKEIQETVDNIAKAKYAHLMVEVLGKAVNTSAKSYAGYQVHKIIQTTPFVAAKQEMLSILNPYILRTTADEILSILTSVTYSQEKLIVLRLIADTLNNASAANKNYIVEKGFTYMADKAEARTILANITARNCVFGTVKDRVAYFLIDVSGSMDERFTTPEGKTYSRLSFVQQELASTIREQLKPYQKFNIISFSTSVSKYTSNGAVNATSDQINNGISFLNRLRASGGTDVWSPLENAFAQESKNFYLTIYLLSDGLPTSGKYTKPVEIVQALKVQNSKRLAAGLQEATVNTIAFLLGKVTPSEKTQSQEFMSSVALATRGTYRSLANDA